MNKCMSALAALTLSAGLTMAPLPAAAAETFHFRATGKQLLATWAVVQPDNCSVSVTTVRVAEQVIQETGRPIRTPSLIVTVDHTYVCGPGGQENPEFLSLFGSTDVANWTIRGDLGAGTLSATVLVSDGGSVTLPVTINVAFTATGPASTARDTFHSNSGGVVVNSHFKFSSAPASATGTIQATLPTVGAVDLTAGAPATDASIATSAFGQITITQQ